MHQAMFKALFHQAYENKITGAQCEKFEVIYERSKTGF